MDCLTAIRARDAARYQLIIDSLDIWFPITGLEFASLNDGVLGAFGYVFFFQTSRILSTFANVMPFQCDYVDHGPSLELGEDSVEDSFQEMSIFRAE